MSKQIRLHAMEMNCMGCNPGLWNHPKDLTHTYRDLDYWLDLAKTLERGLFDSLFIADVLGVYDVYGGNADAAIRNAAEFPVNDPFMVVPAMATVTKHLGFGVTGVLTYEPPFSFARKVSTLDHLTAGRFAWNIVTGYLDSAAKAFGKPNQLPHDERYEVADEYMEVVYKLWEGSWEDDAVTLDKAAHTYARTDKVHKVKHKGKYFDVEAFHLCEPSPQRTPILFQAGASTKGRAFASKHAECVFISGVNKELLANTVRDIRRLAEANGRDPASLLIHTLICALPAKTDAEAQAKYAEYKSYVSMEGTLALCGGYAGIDFSTYDLDEPIKYVKSDAIQAFVEGVTCVDPERAWTLRQVVECIGVGGYSPVFVGSPQSVADQMLDWQDATGVDGFVINYCVNPCDYVDFVDLVVPELQRRGVYKTEYAEGTLREKLYGKGHARLTPPHPGASYRR